MAMNRSDPGGPSGGLTPTTEGTAAATETLAEGFAVAC
jgi:hypothetical protein